jgi:hypothetical protein
VECRETGEAHRVERAPAGCGGNTAEHVVTADDMRDPVLADQRGGRFTVELTHANDVRAAGDRGHRRGIAERTAERYRPEQHRVGRIEPDTPRNVDGMSGDGLLIVQNELRPAGSARGGEGQARRLRRRLVRSGQGGVAIERQYRQVGELRHAARSRKSEHAV